MPSRYFEKRIFKTNANLDKDGFFWCAKEP